MSFGLEMSAREITIRLWDSMGDRANVFDIPLLAERLIHAVRWADRSVAGLPRGSS
jgi:hypothetical protein